MLNNGVVCSSKKINRFRIKIWPRGDSRPYLQLGHWDIFFMLFTVLSTFTISFSPSSSFSMSYFILAIPMHMCLRKHSCMSSTFPIAILNGTCSLDSVKTVIRSGSRVRS